jgi:cell division protein FtsW
MARTLKPDKLLFSAAMLLVSVGVVMVYSASALATASSETSAATAIKQGVWAAIGLVLLFVLMRTDYHVLRRPAVISSLIAVSVVMLLAVFAFPERKGTHRWLSIGGLSMQPSEIAKLAAIIFTAALLDRRMHRINDVKYTLLPIVLVAGGLAGLILAEPDFGTSAVLALVVIAIVFAAGLSYRYLAGTAMLLAPVAAVVVATEAYRLRRVLAFLDPWADPQGAGYQIVQGLIAVGSGGLLGRGLMAGMQKLFYIPEPHNDYIFAVMGEELGLIGSTLALCCFAVLAWRGLRTSLLAPDRLGSLLALGLTMMIVLQAFVNISVVLSMLPPKGIPLPFVSNGGTSLVVNMVAIGILLNISQQASPTAAAAIEGRG